MSGLLQPDSVINTVIAVVTLGFVGFAGWMCVRAIKQAGPVTEIAAGVRRQFISVLVVVWYVVSRLFYIGLAFASLYGIVWLLHWMWRST